MHQSFLSTKSEAATPLSIEIADRLRSKIVHNELTPGTRIQERLFSRELEVSRTPLRDAIKILSREGLVEVTPNYGARVVDFSLDDIEEMLLVYSELDALAGRLACERATPDDLDRIQAFLHDIEKAIEAGDRRAYFSANQEFHIAIVRSAYSPTLLDAYYILNLRLYRTRYLAMTNSDAWMSTALENAPLLDCLRRRDADDMERRIKHHSALAWQFIRTSMLI